ncbi:ferritin-like domain-containing protein [Amycolatopsis magusensis]|uniref:ferritin-like domain-containing protein n=1 Tax=Amycolatopsis magusensis TaxID=882444 RepID=UPI003C2B8F32
MRSRPTPLSRRRFLRAGLLLGSTAVILPLAAACGDGYETAPDELAPLLEQARADATAATALAGGGGAAAELAKQVAAVRTAQADALQSEVDRLNRPKAASTADTAPVTAIGGLKTRLEQARKQAADLVPALPRHRAGLAGAVAAGCASAQQLSPELGAGAADDEVEPDTQTGQLTPEAVESLQGALAAEHAAVWVYSLVTAFLPNDFRSGTENGALAHRDRRDACERLLTAAGADPVSTEPAYLPPKPVTDSKSAMALVATAEADAAAAWRGVLERTDDTALRTIALRALVGSATRGTAWRKEAGEQPPAMALPGT